MFGYKWILREKEYVTGIEESRYKAKLVEKCFPWVEGFDYNEIFSQKVKHCYIRILIIIVNQYNLELKKLVSRLFSYMETLKGHSTWRNLKVF